MVLRGEKQRGEQIERVISLLASRLNKSDAAEAIAFARRLYARVSADDLAAATPEDLAGGAISLWKFGAERAPAKAKIRAFNPRAGEQGWHCGHTVVEIVNDDMPFLVDSVAAALNGMALTIHALIHPIVAVVRDGKGKRTAMPEGLGDPGAAAESVMHVEIDQISDPAMLARIETTLSAVLDDVRAAVADWKPILAQLDDCIAQLETAPPPLPAEEVAEGRALLAWMRDNNFTFLGYRENEFGDAEGRAVVPLANTGLGILRDPARRIMQTPGSEQSAADAAPEARQFMRQPQLLMLLKANARSTVHRAVPLDYIAVKRFDAKGQVIGERRFVGLFTSAAYNRMPADIPYLRRKMRRVVEKSGLAPSSHDGKALQNILDSYPRDELFQISEDELHRIASEIVALQERPRIRLFVRRDEFQRFVSCLIYAPRERFSTELRRKFEAILAATFHGEVTGRTTQIGDDVLARILITVATPPGQPVDTDVEAIEARLVRAARAWEDDLYDALRAARGEEEANAKLRAFGAAFDAAYREHFDAAVALFDLGKLEGLSDDVPLAINLHRPVEAADSAVSLKLYHRGAPVALSDVLPVLENLGLRAVEEHTYEIAESPGRPRAVIHDFQLEDRGGKAIDLGRAKAMLEPAFLAIWNGQAASDGFNRLILLASMDWRQVVILRAIAKYLRQAGIPFSQEYMEGTLATHAGIARLLVALFEARFDPGLADAVRAAAIARVEGDIAALLEAVQSLDEDRIVRRFLNVIECAWRTNHYQRDAAGQPKPWLAFKLDSAKVSDLPAPRPFTEVFVYSPKVEGIHLRGGKVARGGIRWSDRREDFRTEVLGLIKAQQVKNAVIVPVGAKGGFVPMRPPAGGDRDAVMADGIACYKTFITAVLELGDNLTAKGLEHPANTVRHDGDDPYLVVAADKGTATFSDIANGISLEHGFWLGDAFASGGSAGYDHKKMGITARGAWELVKRHFRELGKDIQAEDFTVVGIGDMSGDVFGNGMLLSKHIKLVAAFDHRHIFLDPNPDPAKSWDERKRLFDLPRSSWMDYDARLISAGGGVHDRKAKSIKLTPEVQAALGLTADAMTPMDLMRAILTAEADLLYVGGIGTYVKASTQSQAAAGDRANDGLRVDGKDLRVKVVGEGGNLGFTQLGRVEFAQKGGRLNTDAIDNSAGVDCSDHEVNIKILFSAILASGDMTLKQRDALLAEMTDEVGDLVLQDNYLQGQALTMAQAQGATALDKQARFMRALERRHRLDRAVEYLPDDHALTQRRAEGRGLTRPELAVLLAYAKMALYDDLLAGDLPDDPYFAADLAKYFPRQLRKLYPEEIGRHRLRREIIATSVANSMVNRAGITFIAELQEETRAAAADIARAYAVVRDVFDLRALWAGIEELDNKVPAAVQTAMLGVTREVHKAGIVWLLRHWPGSLDIGAAVATYKPGILELNKQIGSLLTEAAATARNQRQDDLVKAGAPAELAGRIADLEPLTFGFDIVAAAKKAAKPVLEVGAVWFAAGARFSFDWLRTAAAASTPATDWEARAIAALVDDLNAGQRALTAMAVNEPGGGAEAVAAWATHRAAATDRADALLGELRTLGTLDLARLAIAGRALGNMVQSA